MAKADEVEAVGVEDEASFWRRKFDELQARIVDRELAYDGRTLDERIVAVQDAMPDLPQDGHATITTKSGSEYSYDYITEAALMKVLRPLLAANGVAVYYSDELLGFQSGAATVKVSLTFRANGESLTVTSTAHGTDYGDKAASKAKTTGVRYLLAKTFLQGGLDVDPETENVPVDEAQAAHTTREHRAERKERQDDEGRKQRLRSRISQLAVELDEVQGRVPGYWLGQIPEVVQRDVGGPYDQLNERELVQFGEQLSAFVADQRALAEKLGGQGPPADEFQLTIEARAA